MRTPAELELARIAQAEPLDFADPGKYMSLPKDRRIVFSCRSGVRSLDVASYFIGHGFTRVHSMRGQLKMLAPSCWLAALSRSPLTLCNVTGVR